MSRELKALFFCCLLVGCVTDDVLVTPPTKYAPTTSDFSCPESCDDDNMCTADDCNVSDQWCDHRYEPANGLYCQDGNPCSYDEMCHNGACVAPHNFNCDDGNSCTSDFCDSASAKCVSTSINMGCSDGDICTDHDRCKSGVCISTAVICDDDVCKASSSCDPIKGCTNELINVPEVCDDGNADTVDYCSPKSHCQHILPSEYEPSLLLLCLRRDEADAEACSSIQYEVHQADGSWLLKEMNGVGIKFCVNLESVCLAFKAPSAAYPLPVTFNLRTNCKPDQTKVYLGGDKLNVSLDYGESGYVTSLVTAPVSYPAVAGKPAVIAVGLEAICASLLKK